MNETLISKVFLNSLITSRSIYSIGDNVIDRETHSWVYHFVISSSSIISSPFPYFPLKNNGKVYVKDSPNFPLKR